MNTYRKSRLIEVNTLARSARVKMVRECQRPDMDLRHVVGHANLMDHLKHLTLQAQLEIITQAPAVKHIEQIQTSSKEITSDDEDISDDEAIAFESISYSPSNKSTVTVVTCDEDESDSSDSSTDSDDSDDGVYFQKAPTRPAPQPITRSKPIDIPVKTRATAVEVI
jgi:hypothetical protein